MNNMEHFPYPKLLDHFHPLLDAKQLKDKPVAATLMGTPIVLVRLEGQARAFLDSCPHRQIPLSQGTVCNDRLTCSYHGWQFDGDGHVVHTPGVTPCTTKAKVTRFPVQEKDGLIWVSLTNTPIAPTLFSELPDFSMMQYQRTIPCNIFHSIENFLDPCHTHYVHKGLLRNNGAQGMEIRQQVTQDGFETYYDLEEKQNGWINRLFDPGVDQNIGRFHLSGRVELDYLRQGKLLFRVALYFVPIDAKITNIIGRIYIPKTRTPAPIRFALIKPFMQALYRQDKRILEQQQYAQDTFGGHQYFADTDIVAKPLWALLHGQAPTPINIDALDFSPYDK